MSASAWSIALDITLRHFSGIVTNKHQQFSNILLSNYTMHICWLVMQQTNLYLYSTSCVLPSMKHKLGMAAVTGVPATLS